VEGLQVAWSSGGLSVLPLDKTSVISTMESPPGTIPTLKWQIRLPSTEMTVALTALYPARVLLLHLNLTAALGSAAGLPTYLPSCLPKVQITKEGPGSPQRPCAAVRALVGRLKSGKQCCCVA
jgi:hypothetical protein